MAITIRDIAKEANVSHTTVSLVLNRQAGRSIPLPTRRRVIDAATLLGYRPNQFARALASGRTNVIEVRGIRLYDAYYVHMLTALQTILADDGYQVIISPYAPGTGSTVVGAAVKWPVDGIVAIDDSEVYDSQAPDSGAIAPVVCLGAYVSDAGDAVTVDLAGAVTAAMRHLRESGRRRIAYLADVIDETEVQQREVAYSTALRADGSEPEWIFCGIATRTAARDAVADHITQRGVPDAILCRSDSLAIGAMRALADHGIRVPTETAVIGCNGIEEVEFYQPRISTIAIPTLEMCRAAWKMLSRRISDPTLSPQRELFSASLVIRDSSDGRIKSKLLDT